MSLSTNIFFFTGAGCVVMCIGIVAYIMGSPDAVPVSELGQRGYMRQQARKSPYFLLMEPALRLLAAWFAPLPIEPTRASATKLLRQSGHYLGLTPDEFFALCLMSGMGGVVLCGQVFPEIFPMLLFGVLTSGLPYVSVSAAKDRRRVAVTRSLPGSIELIALCVSAGMDFPGALREVIGNKPAEDDSLNQEFRQILRDLDLGHSRKRALLAFRERSEGEGVADFVAALIQSEEKGNPLKEVLQAQAKVLQLRRSFRAEEMAQHAAVKLVVPLALLMFMLLILILAPLILSMEGKGF